MSLALKELLSKTFRVKARTVLLHTALRSTTAADYAEKKRLRSNSHFSTATLKEEKELLKTATKTRKTKLKSFRICINNGLSSFGKYSLKTQVS